jgi:hypothetical protein
MKAKDFIKKLQKFPPNAEIILGYKDNDGDYIMESNRIKIHKNQDLCVNERHYRNFIDDKKILRDKLQDLYKELQKLKLELKTGNEKYQKERDETMLKNAEESDEVKGLILLFTPRFNTDFLDKEIICVKNKIKETEEILAKKIVLLF